jgi:hypothetical protein
MIGRSVRVEDGRGYTASAEQLAPVTEDRDFRRYTGDRMRTKNSPVGADESKDLRKVFAPGRLTGMSKGRDDE